MAKIKKRESLIQSSVIKYLQARRIFYNRINNGQFTLQNNSGKVKSNRVVRCNTIKGIPDIEVFACINHPFKMQFTIYLEIKSTTGRQSKAQKLFESRIKESGGFYFLIRSIDDVVESFKKVEEELSKKMNTTIKLEFLKAYNLVEEGEIK